MRIFQAFNWKLKDVTDNVPMIASQNFTHVLISPIQKCKEGLEWWTLYQPVDFIIGNRTGTKEDLITLATTCRKYGIELMVDVVFAHVSNLSAEQPNKPSLQVASYIRNNESLFRECRNIENWNDRWQLTHWNIGLAGIDTTNDWWIDMCISYLKELMLCGARSFRFDATRHIDPYFFQRIKAELLDPYQLTAIGEVLNCSEYEIDLYSKYLLVLTNCTGGDINRVVKFNCSHDSELNEDSNGFSRQLSEEQIFRDYIEMTKWYKNTMIYPRAFSERWKCEDVKFANLNFVNSNFTN